MSKKAWVVGTALLASLVTAIQVLSSGAEAPFEVASVRFEQNATDGDVEVVFEIKGGDDGMTRLEVVAPDGRTVARFVDPSPSSMGLRQFVFESPEPTDHKKLKAAFPEGTYRFTGAMSGLDLVGDAELEHALPATAVVVHPAPGADGVACANLEINWQELDGVAHYIVELEQDELQVNLTVRMPATHHSFAVPAGFLKPGYEYTLAIGTVAAGGNISFVESTFTTTAEGS